VACSRVVGSVPNPWLRTSRSGHCCLTSHRRVGAGGMGAGMGCPRGGAVAVTGGDAGEVGAAEAPAIKPQVNSASLPGSARSASALFLGSSRDSATPVENRDSLATSEAQRDLSTVTTTSHLDPPLLTQSKMAAALASDSLRCCDELPEAPSRSEYAMAPQYCSSALAEVAVTITVAPSKAAAAPAARSPLMTMPGPRRPSDLAIAIAQCHNNTLQAIP
jgi:hypothetical protein